MKKCGSIVVGLLMIGMFTWITAVYVVDFVWGGEVQMLKVTNIRDTQFTVSWVTEKPEICHVNYGETQKLGNTAYDDRGKGILASTHHVTIRHLRPKTTYWFEVISGDTVDDNGGEYYTVTTAPSIIPVGTAQVYGRVYKGDGKGYAVGAIVYITVQDYDAQGTEGESGLVSVLVDKEGWWFTDLVNFRTKDHKVLFMHSPGDLLCLYAEGGGLRTSVQTLTIEDACRGGVDLVLR